MKGEAGFHRQRREALERVSATATQRPCSKLATVWPGASYLTSLSLAIHVTS